VTTSQSSICESIVFLVCLQVCDLFCCGTSDVRRNVEIYSMKYNSTKRRPTSLPSGRDKNDQFVPVA